MLAEATQHCGEPWYEWLFATVIIIAFFIYMAVIMRGVR
jgi:hypothetical protein